MNRTGLLILLAFALAACGDDDSAPAADAAATSPDAAATSPDGASPDAPPPGPDAGPPPPTDLQLLEELVAALPSAAPAARDGLVRDFIATVQYGEHGFPIRDGGGVIAVVSYGTAGAWTLAGDFNGWDSGLLPLAQPVAGFPFYYRIEPVTPPLPGALYKLVRAGSEWLADPLARRFGWDAFGEYSLAEPRAAASHLERWPAFAEGAGALAPRDLLVYVPAGYAGATASYPVLYLHDGQNLFDPEAIWGGWHAVEAADGAAAPLLLVGIPNTPDRMDEYTHVVDDIGGGPIGGRADEYLAFLVDGVKPFIDARYRTLADRANTGVLGSSLGGLVSVYAGWARPDVFAFAGSMSGSFFWGSYGTTPVSLVFDVAANPPEGVELYLDSGGDDGGGCSDGDGDGLLDDSPDGDNFCVTVQMADTLRDAGWVDEVDLTYRWAAGAQHNEAAWAARLPGALDVFLP